MATVTAFILVGKAGQKQSGIIPTHYIMLYESEQPSLSLHRIDDNKEIIRIRPTIEKLVDNIYLLIYTFVSKAVIYLDKNMIEKGIHKIFNEQKRELSYEKIMECLETDDLKVVFNIFTGSTLLNQIERIKDYPNDYEITITKFKKEYNYQKDRIQYDEFKENPA